MAKRQWEAAVVAWAALGCAAGVVDVWLVRSGRASLTAAARRTRGVAVGACVVLALHFADVLGGWDPFRAAGRVVGRTDG